MYDAVLLGRRGLSLLESLFEQRISAGVLKQEISCPLWFCRPPLDQSKGVLLCVDGSRQALGMADHIGFMLEDEPEHEIVIMYVSKDPQDQGQTEIAKAKAELTANNIPESRIRFVTNCKRRPWQAILGQIKAGNYAAVCLGRKGLGHSGPSSAPLGVTTSKLLKSISNFSMWIYNA
jgi:nucleotide-binding universal stress UspA family protein